MRFSLSALLAVLLLASCAPMTRDQAPPPPPAKPQLYSETFGITNPADVRTLIVLLHGDSADTPPSYQYSAARAFAAAVPDSAVVALLRPGYTDGAGHQSPGERGLATGDNYTADRIAAVAEAILDLRHRYKHARVILAGHSGGAAIAANLAGMYSGRVDGLLLVSCPCMLKEFRAGMKKRMPDTPFDQPVSSFDPMGTVGGVAPTTRAAIVVGQKDEIAPPKLSRGYAEALTLRGIATDFRIVPNQGHEILEDPETIAALRQLAQALEKHP